MAAKIFRINYKSDFILTLNSDAGWMTPFCIKFWTSAPSQAFFVGWDGTTYTHCSYDSSEPTKLVVQFDDHHLPTGDLKFQIAYHFAMADFPNDTEDEVINPASITTEIDGQVYQVMLDFTGETAPEIEFSLPAYANEAQRIANEEQRIADEQTRIDNEAQRIQNEEARINQEQTRQDNEAQRIRNEQTRINQEEARVREFATLKHDAQEATTAANDAAALANQKAQLADDKAVLAQDAAALANEKAQLAADKAVLAQDAAALANEKAQLAADKAALANDAAALANEKAALAQQKAEYAKQQGDYAKRKGDDAATQMQQQAQAFSEAQAARQTAYEQAEGTESGSEAGDGSRWGTFKANEAARDAKVDAKVADITNLQKAVAEGAVYDISANHLTEGVPTKYADLTAALGTDGVNVPVDKRKGGMSIKYIQSSDNKYVQYRLMSDNWSTVVADWQGVEAEAIIGSPNLVISGGIANTLKPIQKVRLGITGRREYIDLSAGVGGVAQINSPQTNISYRYILYPAVAGDIITINGKGGMAPRLYAFVDSNNIILEVADSQLEVTDYVKIAPTNTAWIVINSAQNRPCYYESKDSLNNSFKQYRINETQFGKLNLSLAEEHPVIISSVNGTWTSYSDFRSIIVPVVPSSFYRIKTNNHGCNYAFLSEKPSFVIGDNVPFAEGFTSTVIINTNTTKDVISPTDAKYLCLRSYEEGSNILPDVSSITSYYKFDNKPTHDSPNLLNSGVIYDELDKLARSIVLDSPTLSNYLTEGSVNTGTLVWQSSNRSVIIPIGNATNILIDNEDTKQFQCSLLDENKNVVKSCGIIVSTPGRDIKKKILKVPSDAKYLYFLKELEGIHVFDYIRKVVFIYDDVICNGIFGYAGEYPVLRSGYIQTNGDTVDINDVISHASYKYSVIPVAKGETYKIHGYGGAGPRLWAVSDEEGNILSRADLQELISYVTIPQNGYYLIVNSLSFSYTYVKKWISSPNVNTIKIAASDSSEYEKEQADMVCIGTDDARTINGAIDFLKHGGDIYLSSGNFNLSATRMIFFGTAEQQRAISIKGVSSSTRPVNRSRIYISQDVLNAMSEDTEYKIISGTSEAPPLPEFSENETYEIGDKVKHDGLRYDCILAVTTPGPWNPENWTENTTYRYSFVNAISIENVLISMASAGTQINPDTGKSYGRKIVCIDCRNFGRADLKDVVISTEEAARRRRLHLKAETPVKGSIGIISLPSNNDSHARWDNIVVTGLYIGFKIEGTDHLIVNSTIAARCCYGYWFGGNIQKIATLIQCGDEGCTHLPYFGGQYQGHLDIIDFVIEPYDDNTSPDDPDGNTERKAVEEVQGNYKGTLTYVYQGSSALGESQFWKSGSGVRIKTRNLNNALVGTSNNYPEYLETLFDINTHTWKTYHNGQWW